jgi:hypothetical protein
MSDLYMVLDVESVGLHGEGFAVGYVVVDRDGTPRGEGRYACPPARAAGNEDGRAWVKENVPELSYDFLTPRAMRTRFMIDWYFWKNQGAALVADCGWPVEARFLAACVDDDPEHRAWEGPYPLHDLASIRLAAGLDPLGSNARHNDELPEHDPLADARQSARLLLTALMVLEAKRHPVP